MAEFETDEGKLKEVSSILKAVLTSFGGDLPLDQIDSEYKTVVGSSIPYKELKHGTLASFLQSIPSVLTLENRGGKLVVSVVSDDNIDLILQQVKHQNRAKSKKMVNKKNRYADLSTRQLHANPGTQTHHNTRWQNNTNWHSSNWRTPTIPTRLKFYPNESQANQPYYQWRHPPPGFVGGNRQPIPYRTNAPPPRLSSQVSAPSRSSSFLGSATPSRPPGNTPPSLLDLQLENPQRPPSQRTKTPSVPPGFDSNVSQAHQSFQTTTSTHRVVTQQPSLSQATTKEREKESTSVTVRNDESMKTKAPEKKSFKQQLIEALKELEDNRLQPHFKTVPCGRKTEWCTVIMVGEVHVSSYPDMKSTQEEAEEAASQKALELFTQLAKKKQVAQLPTTTNYKVSVLRVKQLLKERSPNKRFWWEALRDLYCEVCQERLPEDWISTVKNMGNVGLVFDNPCVDKWTVALAEESQAPQSTTKPQSTPAHQEAPHTRSTRSQNSKTEDSDPPPSEQKLQMPPLVLPTTPTWEVFVTCVEEGNTVQLLLVGEQYSGMYSELLTEMELHYMEEKNQKAVKEPVAGEIYVASHEESWLRVELVEVLGDEVKVKFVDHGDVEDIPLANLYFLEAKFFSLPAQAFQCCLAGLEDAPQEAAFKAIVESLPMGKTLVARVQRRQEPHALILFDTSTSEDVNLNEKVFESLVQHMVAPSLPSVGGLVEVYLTHASSEGTLYVQVESKTYKTLVDLLKIAKRRTEEMLGEKVQVDLTKLYLARFSKDGEWYRAAPRSKVDPNGMVLMRFVDFGNSELVPLTNIRGLQTMSPLLEKLPHQALPCSLHNVPSNPELKWTVQACERLMDLASPDTPLLLRVVSEGTATRPPSVQLFKRLLPQNELVSINDTLGMDINLFGSEGDSNNNSVEKEVVVSQFRSQQSSCASGTSSPSLPSESPEVGPDSFPPCFPLCLSDIPDVGSYFDVFVTYAANPNHFAVQPWKMGKRFDELNGSMQNYYHNSANLKHVLDIKIGQYCAVQHSDEIWYRAQVEAVMGASVSGVFVDFGDRFFTTLDKVQPLTPDFCTVPCLAIKAELSGIKAVNRDWSPEDACRFRELAGNKNLVSIMSKKSMKGGSLFLSLVLIDTSEKTVDTYINQVLVDEHRAICLDK